MPDNAAQLGDRELMAEPALLDVYGKDPKFEYRFAHKNEQNVMRKTLVGYEVCTGQSGEKLGATGIAKLQAGSPLMVGDMILMRIPKELYAKRGLMRAERVRQHTGMVEKKFVDEVRKAGGTFVHPITGRQADPTNEGKE